MLLSNLLECAKDWQPTVYSSGGLGKPYLNKKKQVSTVPEVRYKQRQCQVREMCVAALTAADTSTLNSRTCHEQKRERQAYFV